MGTRGRKSAAELSVVATTPDTAIIAPPRHITPEQAEIWRLIVQSMPADWFSKEHTDMLADYCRHTYRHKQISAELEKTDPAQDFKKYDILSRTAERESRAKLAHARALRLTHQSQYDAAKAARVAHKGRRNGPRPWD